MVLVPRLAAAAVLLVVAPSPGSSGRPPDSGGIYFQPHVTTTAATHRMFANDRQSYVDTIHMTSPIDIDGGSPQDKFKLPTSIAEPDNGEYRAAHWNAVMSSRAVGYLTLTGGGWRSPATGMLVAPDLILTADHALRSLPSSRLIDPGQITFARDSKDDLANRPKHSQLALLHRRMRQLGDLGHLTDRTSALQQRFRVAFPTRLKSYYEHDGSKTDALLLKVQPTFALGPAEVLVDPGVLYGYAPVTAKQSLRPGPGDPVWGLFMQASLYTWTGPKQLGQDPNAAHNQPSVHINFQAQGNDNGACQQWGDFQPEGCFGTTVSAPGYESLGGGVMVFPNVAHPRLTQVGIIQGSTNHNAAAASMTEQIDRGHALTVTPIPRNVVNRVDTKLAEVGSVDAPELTFQENWSSRRCAGFCYRLETELGAARTRAAKNRVRRQLTCDNMFRGAKGGSRNKAGLPLGLVGGAIYNGEDKVGIGSIGMVCGPWRRRPYTDDWPSVRIDAFDHPDDAVRRLPGGGHLADALMVAHEAVPTDVAYIRKTGPLPMQLCPPGYALGGIHVGVAADGLARGVEAVNCFALASTTKGPKSKTVSLAAVTAKVDRNEIELEERIGHPSYGSSKPFKLLCSRSKGQVMTGLWVDKPDTGPVTTIGIYCGAGAPIKTD